MLTGSLVALITPMTAAGEIDFPGITKLIELHRKAGTSAVVVLGSTGEASTLSPDERRRLVAAAVKAAGPSLPVVAGIGSNSTAEAISFARAAAAEGAHAGLCVTPYYNRPTQEGLFRHFKAISEQGGLPVILYNVPSRTAVDMTNETVLRLAELPNIIGIKDATAQMGRVADLAASAPRHFALYAGDDETALAFMLLGGHGVISVLANLAPADVSSLCRHALAGRVSEARATNGKYLRLYKALAAETNPIPVKFAMARLGLSGETLRLPLGPLAERFHATVIDALAALR